MGKKNQQIDKQLDRAISVYNLFVHNILAVKEVGDKVALDSIMDGFVEHEVFDLKRVSGVDQQGNPVYDIIKVNQRKLKKSKKKNPM